MKVRGKNAWIGCSLLLSILFQTLKIFIRGVTYPIRAVIKYLTNRNDTIPIIEEKVEGVTGRVKVDNVVSIKEEDVCPEFSEVHNLPGGLLLGIEYITRNPDETALVRILSEDSFSKQYKKKVYTNRGVNSKYIKIDSKKLFLKKNKVHLD